MEGEAGRSAMDPQLMISLWIYAYSEGVSSSREIFRLSGYDPPYQGLTVMEPVIYHTLSDFRVRHKEALDDLFIQGLGLLSAEGLVTLERVMQDGTEVKAKAIYKRRGEAAEFPDAWLKDEIGLRQFCLRGWLKVGMEAVWACLTYNIQQWICLRWRPRLAC